MNDVRRTGGDAAHEEGSDERALYRSGGLCAAGAMALMIASLPMAPPWPQPAGGADAVVAYFTAHRAGFLRQAWFATGGVMLLLPFAAALASLLRAKGHGLAGSTVKAAMLAFVAAFGLNWVPWIEIAFRPGCPRDVTLALYDFGLLGQFIGVGMPLALLFGALALGTRDGAVLPRWLAWLAAACVPLNLALAGCTALAGPMSPSGPLGFGSIGLFTVFCVASSVVMLRRGRAMPPIAAAMAAA